MKHQFSFYVNRTVATFNVSSNANSNKAVTSLDWISKNERYFIHGDNNGAIQLHDTRDCKTIWEIQHDGSRIVSLLCNPNDSTFVCSVSNANEGKLLLYNIKNKQIERTLPLEKNLMALCSSFNHNGQLLVTGLSNGNVLIHDLRRNEIIDNLNCHSSPVIDIELTSDYTNICALSEDGKLCQRSLNRTKKLIWETKIEIEKNFVHGKLFTFDQSGNHMLLCSQNGGNIYTVSIRTLKVYKCKLKIMNLFSDASESASKGVGAEGTQGNSVLRLVDRKSIWNLYNRWCGRKRESLNFALALILLLQDSTQHLHPFVM